MVCQLVLAGCLYVLEDLICDLYDCSGYMTALVI